MLLFDRALTYVTQPSIKEMELIAPVVSEQKTLKILKVVNYIVNIGVPLSVCLLTKCNMIIAALAFVLTDVILCTINGYIFILRPHHKIRQGLLSNAQQNLNLIKEQYNSLTEQVDGPYQFKSVLPCKRKVNKPQQWLKPECTSEQLETFIKYESEWIDKKLKPIKEAEMLEIKKPSKDYEDKKKYFASIKEKLHHYIMQYNINCLNDVLASIQSLTDTLDAKPNGYELVPVTLYLYIDELQSVLSKISNMNTSQISQFDDELTKVSAALSKNINRLVERINNMDTEDVEVSLSVLLQELSKEEADVC